MKGKLLVKVFLYLLIGLIFSSCIDDLMYYESDKKQDKAIRLYKNRHRDEKLHGWWRYKDEIQEYRRYFDVIEGRIRVVDGSGRTSSYWWYTNGNELWKMSRGKGVINEMASYYQLEGDNILKISDSDPRVKTIEDSTTWRTWNRITDETELNSLKQYETY